MTTTKIHYEAATAEIAETFYIHIGTKATIQLPTKITYYIEETIITKRDTTNMTTCVKFIFFLLVIESVLSLVFDGEIVLYF